MKLRALAAHIQIAGDDSLVAEARATTEGMLAEVSDKRLRACFLTSDLALAADLILGLTLTELRKYQNRRVQRANTSGGGEWIRNPRDLRAFSVAWCSP